MSRSGRIISVSGEPGSGKTTFIQDYIDRWRVLHPAGTVIAHDPKREILNYDYAIESAESLDHIADMRVVLLVLDELKVFYPRNSKSELWEQIMTKFRSNGIDIIIMSHHINEQPIFFHYRNPVYVLFRQFVGIRKDLPNHAEIRKLVEENNLKGKYSKKIYEL